MLPTCAAYQSCSRGLISFGRAPTIALLWVLLAYFVSCFCGSSELWPGANIVGLALYYGRQWWWLWLQCDLIAVFKCSAVGAFLVLLFVSCFCGQGCPLGALLVLILLPAFAALQSYSLGRISLGCTYYSGGGGWWCDLIAVF